MLRLQWWSGNVANGVLQTDAAATQCLLYATMKNHD